jgi:hypothetical protein
MMLMLGIEEFQCLPSYQIVAGTARKIATSIWLVPTGKKRVKAHFVKAISMRHSRKKSMPRRAIYSILSKDFDITLELLFSLSGILGHSSTCSIVVESDRAWNFLAEMLSISG